MPRRVLELVLVVHLLVAWPASGRVGKADLQQAEGAAGRVVGLVVSVAPCRDQSREAPFSAFCSKVTLTL